MKNEGKATGGKEDGDEVEGKQIREEVKKKEGLV